MVNYRRCPECKCKLDNSLGGGLYICFKCKVGLDAEQIIEGDIDE